MIKSEKKLVNKFETLMMGHLGRQSTIYGNVMKGVQKKVFELENKAAWNQDGMGTRLITEEDEDDDVNLDMIDRQEMRRLTNSLPPTMNKISHSHHIKGNT